MGVLGQDACGVCRLWSGLGQGLCSLMQEEEGLPDGALLGVFQMFPARKGQGDGQGPGLGEKQN